MTRLGSLTSMLIVAGFAACASNDDAPAETPDASGDDGSVVSPDAGPDTSPPAPVDAGTKDGGSGLRCSIEGWCHTDLGTNEDVVGVWADGQGVAWALVRSAQARIYRWDGASWSLHAKYDNKNPKGIWGSSPTDIYVAAEDFGVGFDPVSGESIVPGQILHGTGTSSSTITWTATRVTRPAAISVSIGGIWGTGPGDVWLAGTENLNTTQRGFVVHVTKATDGSLVGTTDFLAPLAAPPKGPRTLSAVWGTGPGDMWAGGSDTATGDDGSTLQTGAVVMHRTLVGTTPKWTLDPGPNVALGKELPSVIAGTSLAPGKVAISGQRTDAICEAVLFSGVPSWTKMSVAPPVCHIPHALSGTATDLWAVGAGGLVSEWNGTTWRIARTAVDPAPITYTMNALWVAGPDDIWVVGDHGTALHKTKVKP